MNFQIEFSIDPNRFSPEEVMGVAQQTIIALLEFLGHDGAVRCEECQLRLKLFEPISTGKAMSIPMEAVLLPTGGLSRFTYVDDKESPELFWTGSSQLPVSTKQIFDSVFHEFLTRPSLSEGQGP
jgi:hypothetical protein